jgi:hypothetical protein
VIRKLLLLFVVIGIWAVASRVARAMSGRPAPAKARQAASPRFEGAMVRDRVCDTFLPRSRALSVRVGEDEHFFCSTACRDRYLAHAGPAAGR